MPIVNFSFQHFRSRFEKGDALFFIYLLAIAREFFWIIDHNLLAWVLAALLTAVLGWLYVSTKPFPGQDPHHEFWLVVALPVFLLYLLRLPFPDLSFDVLNYHLLHGERSLHGPIFGARDFFPTAAPYNPAPDTVTALFRHALGYRLGTCINLLALIWTAHVVNKILRPTIAQPRLRAPVVFLVILAEQLFFEVNTYMIDLLALPLMMEATYLSLWYDEAENRALLLTHVAFLLGLSAAIKLTNLAVLGPVVGLCVYEAAIGPRRLNIRSLAITTGTSFVAFAVPLLPFALYLEHLTGNPFFPLGNKFFKSAFWETGGGWDGRWGPVGIGETIAWPILAVFHPNRFSELSVNSGRLAIGFVVAILGLIVAWRHRRLRFLCAILIVGCTLWSGGGMGYSRYGLYLDVVAGLVIFGVAAALLKGKRGPLQVATLVLLGALFAMQEVVGVRYILTHEWGMRPTAVSDWHSYAYETRFILRDRSLPAFLHLREQTILNSVQTWIESDMKTTGMEVLINGSAPVISVNHEQYFMTQPAKHLFVNRLRQSDGSAIYSLCFPDNVGAAEEFLNRRGLSVSNKIPVDVPFFSQRDIIGMMLLEIPRPRSPEESAKLDAFWRQAPFGETDYRAEISSVSELPAKVQAGEKFLAKLSVKNLGAQVWPEQGDSRGWYRVTLADRWLDANGADINALDARGTLSGDLNPGAKIEIPLTITAPNVAGDYQLEFDLVHEGITWFRDKGSKTLRVRIKVQ